MQPREYAKTRIKTENRFIRTHVILRCTHFLICHFGFLCDNLLLWGDANAGFDSCKAYYSRFLHNHFFCRVGEFHFGVRRFRATIGSVVFVCGDRRVRFAADRFVNNVGGLCIITMLGVSPRLPSRQSCIHCTEPVRAIVHPANMHPPFFGAFSIREFIHISLGSS